MKIKRFKNFNEHIDLEKIYRRMDLHRSTNNDIYQIINDALIGLTDNGLNVKVVRRYLDKDRIEVDITKPHNTLFNLSDIRDEILTLYDMLKFDYKIESRLFYTYLVRVNKQKEKEIDYNILENKSKKIKDIIKFSITINIEYPD